MRRPTVRVDRRSEVLGWAAFTFLLSCALLAFVLPDLGRYPTVSGDDSWVMSASYKLATEGVFGSDLYAGFHGADQHYFVALPVYQLLQALSFSLFGAGIVTARLVTVASALVVLWATTWLALRWYGALAAGICGLLLAGLRVNLVDLWPGLPLLAVGRTGRYDMTGVAFTMLTVVCLDRAIERGPDRQAWTPWLTGICAGLATLTQFFGAFTVVIIALTLGWHGRQRVSLGWRIAVGWTAVVAPYLLYVAVHWADFHGQAALKAGRTGFLDPTFYLDNLLHEGDRYRHLIETGLTAPSGALNWLFVLGIVPLIAWLGWRARQPERTGDRLLLTLLLGGAGSLALLDSTKAPLYVIVLWPGCCIAIAAAGAAGIAWARGRFTQDQPAAERWLLVAGCCVALVVAAVIVADGADAYRDDRLRAQAVSNYENVAQQLDAAIPAGTGIIGHERWWWGLHERDYRALNVLQLTWEETSGTPSFAAQFDATGAGALIIDDNARSEIGRYPAALQAQIAVFLAERAAPPVIISDPTYGRFEIYILRRRQTAGEVARPVRLWKVVTEDGPEEARRTRGYARGCDVYSRMQATLV
ncbi:MAG TPA: glycosyltransferase family 39 protein [Thermomicrobiales bacterium]|nr:glycosyltransferase family 39 protein [Thermomicrobiales bacterium]